MCQSKVPTKFENLPILRGFCLKSHIFESCHLDHMQNGLDAKFDAFKPFFVLCQNTFLQFCSGHRSVYLFKFNCIPKYLSVLKIADLEMNCERFTVGIFTI